MLCYRQRFCQNNNFFILFTLLLAAGFVLQIKILYNNHQKNLRLQEYKQRINDVSESISSVQKLSNYTSGLISKLEKTMKYYKFNKIRLKQS